MLLVHWTKQGKQTEVLREIEEVIEHYLSDLEGKIPPTLILFRKDKSPLFFLLYPKRFCQALLFQRIKELMNSGEIEADAIVFLQPVLVRPVVAMVYERAMKSNLTPDSFSEKIARAVREQRKIYGVLLYLYTREECMIREVLYNGEGADSGWLDYKELKEEKRLVNISDLFGLLFCEGKELKVEGKLTYESDTENVVVVKCEEAD